MTRKAFSLIELLIALIIISVITASFAPILTHRLKNHGVSISQKGLGFNKCTEIDEKCEICIGNTCYGCSKICNNNQYKDVAKCKCFNCATKYGTNCLTCNNDTCKSCPGGFTPTQDGCLSCSSTYGTACTSCNTSQCTYCKAGYGYNSSTKQCYPCGENEYSTGGLGGCSTCGTGTKVNANKNGCDAISTTPPPAPDAPTCEAGQYLADGTTCVNCAAEGSYTDSKNQKTSCDTCEAGKTSNSTHTGCMGCPYGCKSCIGELCTSCYSCFNLSGGKCTIKGKCPSKSTIVAYQDTCFCMKTRNAGNTDGPSIPTSANASKGVVKVYTYNVYDSYYNSASSIPASSAEHPNCWKGTTANYGGSDSETYSKLGYSYATKTRVVCDHWAAESICKNIGWSLPTYEQLTAISKALRGPDEYNPQLANKKSGLQLCGTGALGDTIIPYCYTMYGFGGTTYYFCGYDGERTSFGSRCKPYMLMGTGNAALEIKTTGYASASNYSSPMANASVRCVKPVE